MSPLRPCRCGLRTVREQVHPVDKSLLLFMLVLLIQSAYSIFCPGGAGQAAEDIDIIVRTSAAAIFGYFLSANFIRHASAGQTPSAAPPHKLGPGGAAGQEPAPPTARIGFSDGTPAAEVPESPDTDPGPAGEQVYANCLQVTVATVIGLFCLVTLLILRNLAQMGLIPSESDSVAATVVQFRDFVSGCVGFLIGCPTHSNSQTP